MTLDYNQLIEKCGTWKTTDIIGSSEVKFDDEWINIKQLKKYLKLIN